MISLFVVQDAPFPPRSGSPLRAWQNIRLLARFGPVHVFSIGKRESDASMPGVASWTHVDAHDFPVRATGLTARLRRALWPREFPIENDFIGKAMNRHLRDVLDRTKPDLIVVSHWHTALPRALRGRHVLVADTHNVEADVAAGTFANASASRRWHDRYRLAQWRRRERSYLRKVDRIWAASALDAASFRTAYAPLPPIDILPNAIDLDAYAGIRGRERTVADAPTIGYIGFFGYGPNADAAATLLETIFPSIRSHVSDARLLLVGRGPTERMRTAADRDAHVCVTGGVDDVRSALRVIDVLVVPLRDGSGTRLKILEAFASRIPVVTTVKGIEGIAAVGGVHAEICDIGEMAERCLRLLVDVEHRRRLTDAAYALVSDRYSWTALAESSAVNECLALVGPPMHKVRP